MDSAEKWWMEDFEAERPWQGIEPSGDQTYDQAVNAAAFGWCHAQQFDHGRSPGWEEVAAEMRERLSGEEPAEESGPEDGGDDEETDLAEWQEHLHPRGPGGKFGKKFGLKLRSASDAAKILDDGGDSRTGVTVPSGKGYKYTPERQKLHDKIVNDFLATARPVSDPEIIFTAGGPASGKSTIVRNLGTMGAKPLPDDIVDINADLIKEKLPEYKTMLDAGDDRAAFFVHKESSDIAARLRAEAIATKRNVLIDQVGNNADGDFAKKIEETRRGTDAEVRVIYADVPVDEAIRRSDKRAAETGRMVPHEIIRSKHEGVVNNFVEVSQMDGVEVEMYSTGGKRPTMVAHKGANGKLSIDDKTLYEEFMSKGGGK